MPRRGIGLAAALLAAQPALGQEAQVATVGEALDPASIPMPSLAFTPTDEDVRNYDKYFYFHREENDFVAAYADLQECDGYARGLAFRTRSDPSVLGNPGLVPPTMAGAVGGAIGYAIGSAMADAIFGSAERRRQRRINMRTCMEFKGYRTYGLSKSLWEEFNFDEGNSRIEEDRRQRLLQLQARAASGPTPNVGEITE